MLTWWRMREADGLLGPEVEGGGAGCFARDANLVCAIALGEEGHGSIQHACIGSHSPRSCSIECCNVCYICRPSSGRSSLYACIGWGTSVSRQHILYVCRTPVSARTPLSSPQYDVQAMNTAELGEAAP